MTNLAFHELMDKHGIRVMTTDVGDRYVLEALRREGGVLGGEQSGHIIWLDGHVTGDGLVAALLLCDALEGRTLEEAVSVLQPLPAGEAERLGSDTRDPGGAPSRDRRTAGPEMAAGCSSARPGRSP